MEKFGNRELSTDHDTLRLRRQTKKMAYKSAAEQLINKLAPSPLFIYCHHAQLLTRIPILGKVTIFREVKECIMTCQIYRKLATYMHFVIRRIS